MAVSSIIMAMCSSKVSGIFGESTAHTKRKSKKEILYSEFKIYIYIYIILFVYSETKNTAFLQRCLVQVHFICFVCLRNICWHGPPCSHLERLHSACLCFSVSLASPWPPSLPVFLHQLHFCLRVSVRTPVILLLSAEAKNRWVAGPFTVITDPFPSHHLASDLLFLSSECGALFLQSRVQKVAMIPVHLGYTPWATSSSKSRDRFFSYY